MDLTLGMPFFQAIFHLMKIVLLKYTQDSLLGSWIFPT